MFDTELQLSTRPKMTPGQAVKARSIADGIRWNRNTRTDIDTKGYAAYLFHLKQVSEVQDKEYEELIISAVDMDTAIEVFNSTCLRGDYYENAEIDIKIMGIDFEPKRVDKIVMGVL